MLSSQFRKLPILIARCGTGIESARNVARPSATCMLHRAAVLARRCGPARSLLCYRRLESGHRNGDIGGVRIRPSEPRPRRVQSPQSQARHRHRSKTADGSPGVRRSDWCRRWVRLMQCSYSPCWCEMLAHTSSATWRAQQPAHCWRHPGMGGEGSSLRPRRGFWY
jgi:hypothetical protein